MQYYCGLLFNEIFVIKLNTMYNGVAGWIYKNHPRQSPHQVQLCKYRKPS